MVLGHQGKADDNGSVDGRLGKDNFFRLTISQSPLQ